MHWYNLLRPLKQYCIPSGTRFMASVSFSGPSLWRLWQQFSRTQQTWGQPSAPSAAAWPPGLCTSQGDHTSCKKEGHVSFLSSYGNINTSDSDPLLICTFTHLILSMSREKMLERLPITPLLPSPLYWPNWGDGKKQVSFLFFFGIWALCGRCLAEDEISIYPQDGLNCLERVCGSGSNGLGNSSNEEDLCWGYLWHK